MKRALVFALMLAAVLPWITGHGWTSRAAAAAHAVTIDYPFDGTIFPPEIEAPTFLWHDAAGEAVRWRVEVTSSSSGATRGFDVAGGAPPAGEIDPECIAVTNALHEPTPYEASAQAWKPSPEQWNAIKALAGHAAFEVVFRGLDDEGAPLSRGSATYRVSPDPVGASIFYRDVPLMPSATEDGVIKPLDQRAQPLITWRLRDISRPESRVLLQQMPTCANCHSFTADGATLAMDIDGPSGDKGAYGIVPIRKKTEIRDEHVMTWTAFSDKPAGHRTLGFMSQISPDGRHVISTVNEAIYVRNFWDYRFSQVFFPTRGILAYFDRSTGQIEALPGADDPDYVHCNATWSPDGKTLVFARARARDPYEAGKPLATYAGDPNETQIQYDLYRMPFNDGRGGTPEPVAGASANGMSNSFPKISPDGKWIVYTQAKNGLLMRPDSRLWIVPLAGGEARELESNLPLMNSWHSFSPNGRWLVFSSKSFTPYTRMFLTHLDEEGHASPPVLIENPTAANRAVNIPEFVNVSFDDFTSISVPAVDHYEHFQRGNDLARAERFEEAIEAYRAALQGANQDWRVNDWRIHESLSKILLRLGQHDLALRHVNESLRLNPANAEMQANLGFLLQQRGAYEEALEHLGTAVRLNPGDAKGWYNRGALRMQMGDRAGAWEDFDRAIAIAPRYVDAYVGRGMLYREAGDVEKALADFDAAVDLNPNNPTALFLRASLKEQTGDAEGALADLDQLRVVAPPDWSHLADVDALEARLRAGLELEE